MLLAVPYHWAAPMATMAVRAGKDVYCEKPIAITVREGRNLVETCQRFGRIYQAGTQQRSEYGGKFRLACELVRNGRIGQLKEVYAYRQPGAFYPDALDLGRSRAGARRDSTGTSGSGRCPGGRTAAKPAMPSPAASSAT